MNFVAVNIIRIH